MKGYLRSVWVGCVLHAYADSVHVRNTANGVKHDSREMDSPGEFRIQDQFLLNVELDVRGIHQPGIELSGPSKRS